MLPIFILCFVSIEHCLIRCQAEGSVSAPHRTYAGSRDEQVRQLNDAGKTSNSYSLLGFNSRARVDSHHVSAGHSCRDDTTSRRTNTRLADAVSAQTLAGNQRKGRQPARRRFFSARPGLMRRLPAVASPTVTNAYQLAASQRVSAQAQPDPPSRTSQVGQRGARKPSVSSPGNRMFRENYQGGSKRRKTVSPTSQRTPSQMSPAESARAPQTMTTPRTVVGYTTQSPVPYNTIFPIAADTGAAAQRKAPRPTTPAPSQPRSSRPRSSYRAAQSSRSLSSNPRSSRRGRILTNVIQTGQKTDASKLPIYIKFPVGRHPDETCHDHQVDRKYRVGEVWSSSFSGCKQSRCIREKNTLLIERRSCPGFLLPSSGQRLKERGMVCALAHGDRRRSFPECCAKVVCKQIVQGKLVDVPHQIDPSAQNKGEGGA